MREGGAGLANALREALETKAVSEAASNLCLVLFPVTREAVEGRRLAPERGADSEVVAGTAAAVATALAGGPAKRLGHLSQSQSLRT